MMRGALFAVFWMAAVATIAVAPGARGSGDPSSADALYELIDVRLELMQAVAAHKWQSQDPVEDLPREAMVVTAAVADGLRHGFKPSTSTATVRSTDRGSQGNPAVLDRPLAGEDEPAVVRRSEYYPSPAIARAWCADHRCGGAPESRAFDRDDSNHWCRPKVSARPAVQRFTRHWLGLREIRHRLEQILDTGTLRVGTTRRLRPLLGSRGRQRLSRHRHRSGTDLAASLGVAVQFVATSWPTSVGGSGRRPLRYRHEWCLPHPRACPSGLFFAFAYHEGGKLPIVRCAEVDRFDTLAEIDAAGCAGDRESRRYQRGIRRQQHSSGR